MAKVHLVADAIARGQGYSCWNKLNASAQRGFIASAHCAIASLATPSPSALRADGECPKCSAPTDPDYGHVGDCKPSALRVAQEAVGMDQARLDFLDTLRGDMVQADRNGEAELVGHDWIVQGQCATVREAIDAMMGTLAPAALSAQGVTVGGFVSAKTGYHYEGDGGPVIPTVTVQFAVDDWAARDQFAAALAAAMGGQP